ncbi:MAG: aminotransferase class IV [Candidatus Aminicenantes bacterium]|nr:MAG: aminotransferase class IV [Candidatus Aminicenantes bacterium]
MNISDERLRKAYEALKEVGIHARVFLSMPVVENATPACLDDQKQAERANTDEGLERRHGIFSLKEASLSVLDHLALYGDGCFEGILIKNNQIFLWQEHIERFFKSAEMLHISIPYSPKQLTELLLRTCQAVDPSLREQGYIRLVVSRGMGDLGINPAKCIGATLFALASSINLYPRSYYEQGISLGVSRNIRRPNAQILNPNIKSNNYINNVLGLLEGAAETDMESIMLTERGFIAEATVDNIFSIERNKDWESDTSKVVARTPRAQYCLIGITRALTIKLLKEEGYTVDDDADMMPIDLMGENRECFMTGTGAGVLPVISVIGKVIGDGRPGPITKSLVEKIQATMNNPAFGLSIDADAAEIDNYLSSPSLLYG